MIARTRWMNWLMGTATLGLSFMLLAGCRSSSGSSSGCSGGCCRGQGYETGAALPPAALRSDHEQLRTDVNGQASKALPATAATAPVQELYGGQKTCPVMGEELGSMGPPMPVTVKGQTIYVCCRGCASKVQRDPDTYLTKVIAERAGR